MHTEAERVTKEIEALREVLGQEELERYQALQSSLGQRRQIRELDQRLGDSDKLNDTQRERLVGAVARTAHLFFPSNVERNNSRHYATARNRPLSGRL
jgi:hypothetical protein